MSHRCGLPTTTLDHKRDSKKKKNLNNVVTFFCAPSRLVLLQPQYGNGRVLCCLQHLYVQVFYCKLILVLEFNYNIRIWITIFISNGYYQFAQALAYQKKGYLWREPHCAMKCWGQVGLQGFLRLRQNESVFWAECHLEEFARLLRGIFFYCCFHFSFQRASLQRSNILSGLDLAEGIWSFNFFTPSMQKGTFI